MKIILIVILLLVANIMVAQDYYNLFSKHLPKEHLMYLSKNAINDQLTSDALLHPNLIFWRISYYNEFIGKKNNNSETNGLNYRRLITVQKHIEKNQWINSQIIILGKKYKAHEYYNTIYELLSANLTEVIQSPITYNNAFQYSDNLDNYFQYVLLSQNIDLLYENNINHGVLLMNEKNKIVNQLVRSLDNIRNGFHLMEMDFPEKVFRYWYLIKENEILFTDIPSMLYDYLVSINSTKKENKYTIQVGYMNKFYNNSTDVVTSKLPEINNPINIATINDINNYALQFRYKYYIRDINSIFSYLYSTVLFNIGMLGDEYPTNSYYRKYDEIDSQNYTSDYYEFISHKSDKGYKYGIYLKLTTPIFLLKENIYVEGGIIGGLEINKYSINTIYNHFRVQVIYKGGYYNNKRLIDEKNMMFSDSKVYKYFYISPIFSINLNILKVLTTELFACYNATGVNVGFAF